MQGKAWRVACRELPRVLYRPRSILRCIYIRPLTSEDMGDYFLLISDKLDRHNMRESANTLAQRVRVVSTSFDLSVCTWSRQTKSETSRAHASAILLS